MQKNLDKYSGTVILFYVAAFAFVATPLLYGLDDFVTGIFVVAGMTCTIMGSFVFMFTGNEPIDPRFVGLLPVQGCLNLCRLATGAGVFGKAYFLPPQMTPEERVMQFNPESTYSGDMDAFTESFAEEASRGLFTIPSADPLMQDLRKRHALIIPKRVDQLPILIRETVSDVFEFSPKVTTDIGRDKITVTLHKYRFIEGCLYARSVSPNCCTRFPCPACSLCGMLIAECTGKAVAMEVCDLTSNRDITAVFSFSKR
jgi:hypothetical protein